MKRGNWIKATIVGAGALGLGYLAERLAPAYDICLVDLAARVPWLRRVEQEQGYWLNICGSAGVERRWVDGLFRVLFLDRDGDHEELDSRLRETDLIFTAVGRKNLDNVLIELAPRLVERQRKVWLLFCENGRGLAERYSNRTGRHTVALDTVMSRMCRFAGEGERERYESMWPGESLWLAVEQYSHLPLDGSLCGDGPFNEAFSLMSAEQFRMWQDIKLFLHNGMHAFISYHAYLDGVRFFPEVPLPLCRRAHWVAMSEIVPALAHRHACARLDDLQRFTDALFDRLLNPSFHDSIERGIRGSGRSWHRANVSLGDVN